MRNGSLAFTLDNSVIFQYNISAPDTSYFKIDAVKFEKYSLLDLKSNSPGPSGQNVYKPLSNAPTEFILQGMEIFYWNKGDGTGGGQGNQLMSYLTVTNEDLTALCKETYNLTRYHPVDLLPENIDIRNMFFDITKQSKNHLIYQIKEQRAIDAVSKIVNVTFEGGPAEGALIESEVKDVLEERNR